MNIHPAALTQVALSSITFDDGLYPRVSGHDPGIVQKYARNIECYSKDGVSVLHSKGKIIAALRNGEIFFPQRDTQLCVDVWNEWRGPVEQDHSEPTEKDVYFIQCNPSGPIKIGVASNVNARRDALQTSSPYPLKILAVIPGGGKEMERDLHQMFSEYRLSGEWFMKCNKLMEIINNAA